MPIKTGYLLHRPLTQSTALAIQVPTPKAGIIDVENIVKMKVYEVWLNN